MLCKNDCSSNTGNWVPKWRICCNQKLCICFQRCGYDLLHLVLTVSCYFLHLRSKDSPQHSFVKQSVVFFPLTCYFVVILLLVAGCDGLIHIFLFPAGVPWNVLLILHHGPCRLYWTNVKNFLCKYMKCCWISSGLTVWYRACITNWMSIGTLVPLEGFLGAHENFKIFVIIS